MTIKITRFVIVKPTVINLRLPQKIKKKEKSYDNMVGSQYLYFTKNLSISNKIQKNIRTWELCNEFYFE